MRWREVDDCGHRYWQYIGRHGVYGTVTQHPLLQVDGKQVWCARVMADCRLPDMAGSSPRGKALTLDGAKRVVELLCVVTGTADDIANDEVSG